jgi:hypothetical protein
VVEKRQKQVLISNLSMDLIGRALELVQYEAFPVYKRNIDRREPPFAHGEFAPSAMAVLLLTSGLDYHLARLKYLRDVYRHDPPLPQYFNWKIGDYLPDKLNKLLFKRSEKRLREQLIELTILRDSVAHPRFYVVEREMKSDYSFTKERAKLSDGEKHREKVLNRKMGRSERTKSLRLPLVPIWISYVDVVTCVLVLNRFLNLIEHRYGNPFGWVGNFSVKNVPPDFFHERRETTRRSIPLKDWAQAFHDSLAPSDQRKVSKYISKRLTPPRVVRKGGIVDALWELRNPPEPEFLRKPPPWKMKP